MKKQNNYFSPNINDTYTRQGRQKAKFEQVNINNNKNNLPYEKRIITSPKLNKEQDKSPIIGRNRIYQTNTDTTTSKQLSKYISENNKTYKTDNKTIQKPEYKKINYSKFVIKI